MNFTLQTWHFKANVIFNYINCSYVVVSKLSIKYEGQAPEKEREGEIKGNAHCHGHQSYLALAHISPRGRSIYFRTSSALKRWDYALSPLSSFGDGCEMQREKGVIREKKLWYSAVQCPALLCLHSVTHVPLVFLSIAANISRITSMSSLFFISLFFLFLSFPFPFEIIENVLSMNQFYQWQIQAFSVFKSQMSGNLCVLLPVKQPPYHHHKQREATAFPVNPNCKKHMQIACSLLQINGNIIKLL